MDLYARMNTANKWVVGGLAVAALLAFQIFVRYQYVHLVGVRVMRIDRLTSTSCYMPCPDPTSSPEKPARTFESDDEDAISRVRMIAGAPYENDAHEYMWRVYERVKSDGTQTFMTQDMSNEDSADYPIRLVCYCYSGQKSPTGVYWEYHLDTRQILSVGDDALLSAKYGMTKAKK